ncbi:DNA photolyase [Methyloprofundus sedimenti]|uniref:DNA photolyase n=1 Tax=Methyloprofundus sedimenti TaxID=1420851 RepID=A0A1V8M4X6_9GAMM|nr:DNA photolyase [Methyloprofundus sedimenti]OQK16620.1 DNA photolyase [Methyloprofundus sedimenti]
MIETIYIEENILQHPRVLDICARFPKARKITCGRYGEVFNPKAQNFRIQKQQPALILAEKYRGFMLKAPPNYGIGAKHNYYFSHMLNCLYDCRYCFLQGMYQSANYVLFVNYEDYFTDIQRLSAVTPDQAVHFFSGYDCDSLALEPVTDFVQEFLPVIRAIPNAWMELRTKSTQVRHLLDTPAFERCIVAFSFTPDEIASALEHKAPAISKRLDALNKLQNHGWPIGLRFDPIIYEDEYQLHYQNLFKTVFAKINPDTLHSVSLGVFRLPDKYFKKIHKLYPEEKLFVSPLESKQGMMSYKTALEDEMMTFCTHELLAYIPEEKFFPCSM